MLLRTDYLGRIEPFIGTDVVKVFTGIRRSGKSTLLRQVQELLAERGIPADAMLTMNFESMEWDELTCSHRAFYDYVAEWAAKRTGKVYLFFDEVQQVEGWERAINALRVDMDCDIYVTGSNSQMLSKDLATLLAGRYVEFPVMPFSFSELLKAMGGEPGITANGVFDMYRRLGSFPFLTHISYSQPSSTSYLRDVFNSVVLKDISQRASIRDTEKLERVLSYFISEVGNTYSVANLANVLAEERRPTSRDTIYSYLKAAEDAFLLYRVRRFDIRGKAWLRGEEKVYVADVGLRQPIIGDNDARIDRVLENIVYLFLRQRGYEVGVGRNGSKEIDFVAHRGGKTLYVQVAYLMEQQSTREREFDAFEGIEDNYPKYVVSMDPVDFSHDGYIHMNIVDFLVVEEL